MAKKCKKCGRIVTGYCRHCDSYDIVDAIVDLGTGYLINSAIDNLFDSSSSGGSSSDSSSTDFGGGDFGGGGAGGDW